MIDAIVVNRDPLVSGEEGEKGIAIILAVYKSRLTGLPVKFPMTNFSTMELIGIIGVNREVKYDEKSELYIDGN